MELKRGDRVSDPILGNGTVKSRVVYRMPDLEPCVLVVWDEMIHINPTYVHIEGLTRVTPDAEGRTA